MKLTPDGDSLWTKFYCSTYDDDNNCPEDIYREDRGLAVIQTNDFGYAFTGQTIVSNQHQIWLVKTDSEGVKEWQKTYGLSNTSIQGESIVQCNDGGYIVVGSMESQGNGLDLWILKTDQFGETVYEITQGGISTDQAYSIQETFPASGEYLIIGATRSFGNGGYDAWVLKINEFGTILWNETYGGTENDVGYSIEATEHPDGSITYTFCGKTRSFGNGNDDIWIMQLDTEGNELYNHAIGGTNSDKARSIKTASDGGFIIVGETSSIGQGGLDGIIIKTDSHGNTVNIE